MVTVPTKAPTVAEQPQSPLKVCYINKPAPFLLFHFLLNLIIYSMSVQKKKTNEAKVPTTAPVVAEQPQSPLKVCFSFSAPFFCFFSFFFKLILFFMFVCVCVQTKKNKQLALLDIDETAAVPLDGRRPRRAAATAADAAIAQTNAFGMSPASAAQQVAVLKLYEEEAARQEAFLQEAFSPQPASPRKKPSTSSKKRKAPPPPAAASGGEDPAVKEPAAKKSRGPLFGVLEEVKAKQQQEQQVVVAPASAVAPIETATATSPPPPLLPVALPSASSLSIDDAVEGTTESSLSERSKRTSKPSLRLVGMTAAPTQKRKYIRSNQYSKKGSTGAAPSSSSPLLLLPPASMFAPMAASTAAIDGFGMHSAVANGDDPDHSQFQQQQQAIEEGQQPFFLPAPVGKKPETPEQAGTDIPSLIAMTAGCDSLEAVFAAIDLRMPPYKGNNIHARFLRIAFQTLRLGTFTQRKNSVPILAKKLWLLAGKLGEEAAQEAAASVGMDHLPENLKAFGAVDATPVNATVSMDTAIEKYFGPIVLPKPRVYNTGGGGGSGGGGGGARAGGSTKATAPAPAVAVAPTSRASGGENIKAFSFVPPVIDISKYDERLLRFAEMGRALLGQRRGEPVKLQQILKTKLLVGQKVQYENRTGIVMETGEITERGQIMCNCSKCNGEKEVTPTDFEIHAGSGDRRPADSIYFADFHHTMRDLLTVMASNCVAATEIHMDACLMCRTGGDLVCCDGCTAALHLECAGLEEVPEGQWLCAACAHERDGLTMPLPVRTSASSAGGNASGSSSSSRGRGRGSRGGGRGRGMSGGGGGGGRSGGRGRGGGYGRVHMMAPSANRRNGRPLLRNLNRNKRLFEGGEGGLKDGAIVHYMNRGNIVKSGVVVINPGGQSGILCECCNRVISCSQFESHAGHSQRRQPYECIFTEDGRNLKSIAALLPAPEGAEAGVVEGDDEEDDGEIVEGDGKNGSSAGGCVLCHDPEFQKGAFGPRTMMLCDQCEREFHVGCMAVAGMKTLSGLPEGDWFCSAACGKIHGLLRAHVAAGPVSVAFGAEDGLPRSLLPGSTAEKEALEVAAAANAAAAAVAAIQASEINKVEVENRENGVLGGDTGAVETTTTTAIDAAAAVVDGDVAAFGDGAGPSTAAAPPPTTRIISLLPSPPPPPPPPPLPIAPLASDYTWQMLNGRDGKIYTTYSVKAAADILQESFDPIVDLSTGTDLLPLMLYAHQYGDWDYRGVYTLLLRYKGKPVVAATSRVFGPQYAELPLIATRMTARRQGHARVLLNLFFELLGNAGVHTLILPAAHETVETWKEGFGFVDMPEAEVALAKHQLRILVFPGTEVLWKVVEGTEEAVGHHVLQEMPEYEDVKAVRGILHEIVTAVSVAEGEEQPKRKPPPPQPPRRSVGVAPLAQSAGAVIAVVDGCGGGVGSSSRGGGDVGLVVEDVIEPVAAAAAVAVPPAAAAAANGRDLSLSVEKQLESLPALNSSFESLLAQAMGGGAVVDGDGDVLME